MKFLLCLDLKLCLKLFVVLQNIVWIYYIVVGIYYLIIEHAQERNTATDPMIVVLLPVFAKLLVVQEEEHHKICRMPILVFFAIKMTSGCFIPTEDE